MKISAGCRFILMLVTGIFLFVSAGLVYSGYLSEKEQLQDSQSSPSARQMPTSTPQMAPTSSPTPVPVTPLPITAPSPSPTSIPKPTHTSPMTKEEAIEQAKAYRPKMMCATVMTPAIHIETGAAYTFPSSCIAPGWKKVSNAAM